jgi:mannosyl-3-phosphoglycerate phosphatase
MNGSRERLIVFSDLDGTLLDPETYGWDEARPAVDTLRRLEIPLVLASSKTRGEVAVHARAMNLKTPFVAENGGVVVVPQDYFGHAVPGSERHEGFDILPLGVPRRDLVTALGEMALKIGARVRGFASLGLAEVQRLTGLSGGAARLALDREHDEPFVVDDEDSIAALSAAAKDRKLNVTRGGRFFHLTGGSDKGRAARVLMGLFEAVGKRLTSVGLGDAQNDLTLLAAVQHPIVIPRPDGTADPALAESLPGAQVASRSGPAGWNEAVLAVLRGETLPRAGGPGRLIDPRDEDRRARRRAAAVRPSEE